MASAPTFFFPQSVLAENPASGPPPGQFNGPAGQPVRTAKTVAATKRKTTRTNSQQKMWKTGSATTLPRGMSALRQVSQLPEVAQAQPPPVKARTRRVTRPARSSKHTTSFPQQPATAMPSRRGDEPGASQGQLDHTGAAQVATPQVEATLYPMHTRPSVIAEPSAASWAEGEHGDWKSTPDCGLFSWANATAAQISRRCGLDRIPLDLIEQVLPCFRVYLQESGHSAAVQTCQPSQAQSLAPVASALPQDPWPSSAKTSELLTVPQLPALFHAQEQSTAFFPTDSPVWAPEPGPSTIAECPLTYEELGALEAAFLQEQGYAELERVMQEGPSAALDFILNIEHSQAVEAGSEAQSAGTGGIWRGEPDFGRSLDGWEGWDEPGYHNMDGVRP